MDKDAEPVIENPKEVDGSQEQSAFIAELYPKLTAEQQEEAAYFLNRYLDVIERIYERTINR